MSGLRLTRRTSERAGYCFIKVERAGIGELQSSCIVDALRGRFEVVAFTSDGSNAIELEVPKDVTNDNLEEYLRFILRLPKPSSKG